MKQLKQPGKAALGFALAMALVLGTALFAGAGAQELKVLVASDIHYRPLSALPPLGEANYLSGDPLFRHANSKGMLTYEADAVLDAFFREAERSGARFLLIPGDLSEEGHWAEHLGIAQKLREFQRRSGIQVFVLPGNHDIRTSASRGRLDLPDFLEVYADLGYDKALARFEGDASYTAELAGGYRLLAVDACVYREDESAVSQELFGWIAAQLARARADGKKVVAMTHYNVLEHFGLEGLLAGLLCIDRYREVAALLADGGAKYVFTGHGHANDISHAVTGAGNKIFDTETGSLITYPNAWREVTFAEDAVRIETRYVERIDAALLPEGFTPAQLALMEQDFPGYSLRYMRAGFRGYAHMIPDLTQTLAESLGAAEGSAGYQAVDAAVAALARAVRLPLYGETGSVEAIAKTAGVALAPSGYENLLDLAGALYAGHYAGNEDAPMDSLEVRLLGQAINAVLASALTELPAQAAGALLAAAGLPAPPAPSPAWAARGIYRPSPAKAVTNELVRALAEGIFTDWCAPDDLSAALEPYGARRDVAGRAVRVTDFTYALDLAGRVCTMALRMAARLAGAA